MAISAGGGAQTGEVLGDKKRRGSARRSRKTDERLARSCRYGTAEPIRRGGRHARYSLLPRR